MTCTIALLGEQPLPALIPSWQYSNITCVHLVTSQLTLSLAHHLACDAADALSIFPKATVSPVVLAPYDLPGNTQKLVKLIRSLQAQGETVWVNLTGGTKLMSFAAINAAKQTEAHCLYVSTERGVITHFDPSTGNTIQEDRLKVSLSVDEYLVAHQIEVSDNQAFDPSREADYSMAKAGDPLEILVETKLRDSGLFDDIRRTVFIRKQMKAYSTINELDVVVTKGVRLGVCSCKSGRNITNDDVYELAALSKRESAGIYCGKLLVVDQPNLPYGIKARARSEGVSLLYGKQIDRVAEVLFDLLS